MKTKFVSILLVALMLPTLLLAQQYPSPTFNNATVNTINSKAIPSGAFVGTTDTQTLTNKSISAPQINFGQFDNARLPTIMQNGTSLVPSYAQAVTTTATSTSGSATITVTSAAGIQIGQQAFGAFVQAETLVSNVVGTTVTLSKTATATNVAPVAVQFGQDRFSATSTTLTNTLGAETIYAGRAAQGNFTWLNTVFPGSDYRTLSTLTSIALPGSAGVSGIFATRSSDNNGSFGAALNVNITTVMDGYTGSNRDSWGLYNEANLTSGVVGYHMNEESSVYSLWPYQATDPYSYNQLGGTRNLRLDCGKGPSGAGPQSCSAALEIIQNDAKYGKGIVFGSDAVLPFVDGTQPVIVMAKDQALHWFQANNTPGWAIVSTKSTGAEKKLTLGNSSVQIGGSADLDVNGHIFQGAAPPAISACGGGSPALSAGSTDTQGVVTEGTTATGCVLTFAKAYTFPPSCVVSSPTGSAFTSYTATTTTLTIVNASASGNKYAYICLGG